MVAYSTVRLPRAVNAPLAIDVIWLNCNPLHHQCVKTHAVLECIVTDNLVRLPSPENAALGIEVIWFLAKSLHKQFCENSHW
jgi:hypothetical protein